jgi:hypothetical protein
MRIDHLLLFVRLFSSDRIYGCDTYHYYYRFGQDRSFAIWLLDFHIFFVFGELIR